MNWIANNQGLFEKEICLPPSVSVQIDDARFAPLVESSLNRNQLHVSLYVISYSFTSCKLAHPFHRCLQTFIAQTEKDYKTLNRLNDEPHYSQDGRRQRVRIATYQVTERDLQDLDKPRIIPPADVSRPSDRKIRQTHSSAFLRSISAATIWLEWVCYRFCAGVRPGRRFLVLDSTS